MVKENLNELSTEDLIKKKKTGSLATGILAGVLIALLIVAINLTNKKGLIDFNLVAVALGLSPILFLNYKNIQKIDEELKSRNSN